MISQSFRSAFVGVLAIAASALFTAGASADDGRVLEPSPGTGPPLQAEPPAIEEIVVSGGRAASSFEIERLRADVREHMRALNERLRETLEAELKQFADATLNLAEADVRPAVDLPPG
ncbi:MAG TPA: hypothetical protein VF329_06375 [Gammaproteobacteria bacterium]